MFYSQKDPRWATQKLGTGNKTLGQAACFITSIGNLLNYNSQADFTPPEMNALGIKHGFFTNGDMLVAPKVATFFGYPYERTTVAPDEVCIIETNAYAKVGVPQHFCLYDPETKKRVDPLDYPNPTWEPNTYHIVSYRVFKGKSQSESIATSVPHVVAQDTTASVPVEVVPEPPTVTMTVEPSKLTQEVPEKSEMIQDTKEEVKPLPSSIPEATEETVSPVELAWRAIINVLKYLYEKMVRK